MAYTEPVLTKRIDPDPARRKTVWYDEYVATGGYAQLRRARASCPRHPFQMSRGIIQRRSDTHRARRS